MSKKSKTPFLDAALEAIINKVTTQIPADMSPPDPFSVDALATATPKDKPLELKAMSNVERAQAIEELTVIKSIIASYDGISIAFLQHLISSLQYYQLQKAS